MEWCAYGLPPTCCVSFPGPSALADSRVCRYEAVQEVTEDPVQHAQELDFLHGLEQDYDGSHGFQARQGMRPPLGMHQAQRPIMPQGMPGGFPQQQQQLQDFSGTSQPHIMPGYPFNGDQMQRGSVPGGVIMPQAMHLKSPAMPGSYHCR
jgi:hypothetical protein